MLVIRLFRTGKKNQPFFKIVVTDKRKPTRAGRFVEQVGFWNPLTKEKNLKSERIKHWLSKGAKPSATLYNMLVSEKIIEGKKIPVHKKSKKKPESQARPEAQASAAQIAPAEAPQADQAPALEPAKSVGEKLSPEKPTEEQPKKEGQLKA